MSANKREYYGAALMLFASSLNACGNVAGIALGKTNGNPFFATSLATSLLYMASASSSIYNTYQKRRTFVEAERERRLPELTSISVAR